jgi:hypothetical protein
MHGYGSFKIAYPLFVSSVLFTDATIFGRDGITNFSTHHTSGQRRIHVVKSLLDNSISELMCGLCLVGPHDLPQHLRENV